VAIGSRLWVVEPTSEESGELLARTLLSLEAEQAIYLPRLGWLQMKRYRPYQGRGPNSDPDKYLLSYFTDPDLYGELCGVRPERRAYATERDRFLAWIHVNDPNFDMSLEDPAIMVSRYMWSDGVAAELQRRLLEKGTLSIPHVGTFELVVRDGGGRSAMYRLAEDLKDRLQSAKRF
jgi:hypothetical protein